MLTTGQEQCSQSKRVGGGGGGHARLRTVMRPLMDQPRGWPVPERYPRTGARMPADWQRVPGLLGSALRGAGLCATSSFA